jgi:hypothetical protein
MNRSIREEQRTRAKGRVECVLFGNDRSTGTYWNIRLCNVHLTPAHGNPDQPTWEYADDQLTEIKNIVSGNANVAFGGDFNVEPRVARSDHATRCGVPRPPALCSCGHRRRPAPRRCLAP